MAVIEDFKQLKDQRVYLANIVRNIFKATVCTHTVNESVHNFLV